MIKIQATISPEWHYFVRYLRPELLLDPQDWMGSIGEDFKNLVLQEMRRSEEVTPYTRAWRIRRGFPPTVNHGSSAWLDTGLLMRVGLKGFTRKRGLGFSVGVEPVRDRHPLWSERSGYDLSFADIFQMVHQGAPGRKTADGKPNPLPARPVLTTALASIHGGGVNNKILKDLHKRQLESFKVRLHGRG